MPDKPLKAMILAAGLGKRLDPLTSDTPKALVPFFGAPLLSWAIQRLKDIDIDDFAINTHHHADQISKHASSYAHISHEPVLLGTGGALTPIQTWRNGHPLLVINADIVTHFDLNRLLLTHQSHHSIITLGLLPRSLDHELRLVTQNHRLQCFETHGSHSTFSGIQILSDSFFSYLPNSPVFPILSIYKDLLNKQVPIHTYTDPHPFWDLGTHARYLTAHYERLFHADHHLDLDQLLHLMDELKALGQSLFLSKDYTTSIHSESVTKQSSFDKPLQPITSYTDHHQKDNDWVYPRCIDIQGLPTSNKKDWFKTSGLIKARGFILDQNRSILIFLNHPQTLIILESDKAPIKQAYEAKHSGILFKNQLISLPPPSLKAHAQSGDQNLHSHEPCLGS